MELSYQVERARQMIAYIYIYLYMNQEYQRTDPSIINSILHLISDFAETPHL